VKAAFYPRTPVDKDFIRSQKVTNRSQNATISDQYKLKFPLLEMLRSDT